MVETLISTGLFATAITIIASILLALYVWNRAGSLGFVLDRLWRLAGGRTEIFDPSLLRIDQAHAQLEYFNYKFRLGVEQLEDIKQIETFLGTHQISMEKLCRMRPWFSLQPRPKLTQASAVSRTGVFFLGLMLYLVMAAAIWAFSYNQTYLWFSKTGERFRTDGRVAVGDVFGPNEIVLSECRSFIDNGEDITQEERLTTLCDTADDPDFQALVRRSLRFQRLVLAIVFLFCGGTVFFCVRYVRGSMEAQKLFERIPASGAPPSSETSPSDSDSTNVVAPPGSA